MGKADKGHSKRRRPTSRGKAASPLRVTDLPPGKPLAWALSHYEDTTILLDPRAAIERRLQRLCTDLERRECYLSWRAGPTADREVLALNRCRDLKLPSPPKAPNLPRPGLDTLILDERELHDVLIHPAPRANRPQEPARYARTKLETDVEAWLAERWAEGKPPPTERDCRRWASRHGYTQAAVWQVVRPPNPPRGRRPQASKLRDISQKCSIALKENVAGGNVAASLLTTKPVVDTERNS
jgi:hypothetical protein